LNRLVTTIRPAPVDVVVIDNTWTARSAVSTLALTAPTVVRSVRAYEDVSDVDLDEPAPHVILLDYWLGRDERPCIPHVPELKRWGAKVLLFTSEERPIHLRRALQAGVDGLCLKNDSPETLVDAIASAGRGQVVFSSPLAHAAATDDQLRPQLTAREIDVLEGLAYGLTADDIAGRLLLAPATVKSHIQHIHDKYRSVFGDRINRGRLVHEAHRDGYLDTRNPSNDPPGR